jgi:succinate-semialdehyde dehydrogenase/glutarate-semialdehyde dehydrogenase
MAITSINPATEEVLATFDEHTPDQVEQALQAAATTFKTWRKTSFAERAKLVKAAGAYLRANKERFGGLITAEMGKPIAESIAEIEKSAWNCDFYAENAERFLSPEHIGSSATESYIAYEPLGTVLAVMPWNYPFWQVIRFLAPALMAGNTSLLKHASNNPQCALAIEEVITNSGFPAGAFKTLLIGGAAVHPVIEDPRIHAVTLTGSDITGSKIAETAGRALKKCVLELGGSDPFIVLADADLQGAAEVGARARFQNTGQSCIAAKRFIVEDSVAQEFEERFVAAVSKMVVGDPMDPKTHIGPMSRGDLRDELADQVKRTVEQGATVALGGHALERKGYFYAPTVLTGVTPSMTAFREETFGPAAAVIRVGDAEEAVDMANDSVFGLGGALWTRNIERGKQLARDVQSGAVFINGMTASDPRLPFGGVKRSGYGRELSHLGIREFVNIQTVWIGPAVTPQPTTAASE